jgi:hypothetical protein
MSKPLQVYLEESELRRLEAWARARGWTKSQAVRAAIRAVLREPADRDSILSLGGIVDGLPPDLSENIDRYLAETYVAEPPARYRLRRRAKAVRRH